jgi:hypothetical protein
MQHLLFPKHTSQRRMEIRLFRKHHFMNPNLFSRMLNGPRHESRVSGF